MNMASIGLILIALAWLVQLYFLFKGNREIQPAFIVLYMIGVLGLVVNNTAASGIAGAKFELFTLIASGIALIKLLTSR